MTNTTAAIKYQVIGTNSGSVALAVYDGDKLVYIYNSYEQHGTGIDNSINADIVQLRNPETTISDILNNWDGSQLDEMIERVIGWHNDTAEQDGKGPRDVDNDDDRAWAIAKIINDDLNHETNELLADQDTEYITNRDGGAGGYQCCKYLPAIYGGKLPNLDKDFAVWYVVVTRWGDSIACRDRADARREMNIDGGTIYTTLTPRLYVGSEEEWKRLIRKSVLLEVRDGDNILDVVDLRDGYR